jgi:hypothetical protein
VKPGSRFSLNRHDPDDTGDYKNPAGVGFAKIRIL